MPVDESEPADDMARSVEAEDEGRAIAEDPGASTPSAEPTADPTDAPDLAGSALTRLARFGLIRALLQIVLALAVVLLSLLSPGRVSLILERATGGALIVLAVVAMVMEAKSQERHVGVVAAGAAATIIGVLLLVDPDRWLTPIGWTIGVALVVFGVRAVAQVIGSDAEARGTGVRRAVLLLAGGAVAFFFLEAIFEVAAVLIALVAVASGVVRLGVRSGLTTVAPSRNRSRPMLVRWIDGRTKETKHRDEIHEAIFFEGERAPARIGRFLLMMLFASVISAAGVLSDSTAVVIGAMLVAPLINPMMGIGLSLATGWPNRLGRSTFVVIGGTLVAIGTAWILSTVTDVAVDLDTNTQIVSRSSPGLIDLVIAVAAGSAGAYALSRKDASSSLPGVAVAIALVPPLSVVGITAEAGDWQQAAGTLLLFMTNLVAIILAGGAVFVLTGVVPLQRVAEHQHRVRTAFAAVISLAVIVVGGLVINGRQITEDSLDQDDARQVVASWLGEDSNFDVVTVTVDDGDVAVLLAGPGDPGDAQQLADDLDDALGGGIRLDLQWVPRQRTIVNSG